MELVAELRTGSLPFSGHRFLLLGGRFLCGLTWHPRSITFANEEKLSDAWRYETYK